MKRLILLLSLALVSCTTTDYHYATYREVASAPATEAVADEFTIPQIEAYPQSSDGIYSDSLYISTLAGYVATASNPAYNDELPEEVLISGPPPPVYVEELYEAEYNVDEIIAMLEEQGEFDNLEATSAGEPITPFQNAVLDTVYANAEFSLPAEANYLDPISAKLIMTPEGVVATVTMNESDEVRISEVIPVTKKVQAILTAPEFDITPETPETQRLYAGSTQWHWTLIPTSWGENEVHLIVNGIIESETEKEELTLHTFKRTLIVDVSFGQYVWYYLDKHLDILKWIIGSLLVPLLIWLYKKYIKKEDE